MFNPLCYKGKVKSVDPCPGILEILDSQVFVDDK